MQETEFIGQNKKKWKEFEETLKSSNKDPDHLTQLFIETTDDLSFSQTHYPNRSVRVYLNSVSQKVYQIIYKRKRKEKNKVKSLWRTEIPSSLFFAQKALFFSLILFVLGITIGVFSNMFYPDFSSIVLSPSYVQMTEEYIANGDPMAVYKQGDAFEMFFHIALNNIRISFAAFVLGLAWGVGTAWLLLSNGIMFGAFMHFFFTRGLWKASILAVMQHGTLELSMIVISGAAGFTLAKGLIFPGTYSRIDALVISARNGIKIMVPVFFFLLYAAFIESYFTRLTELPDVIRIASILLSLTIVVGYFFIYPRIIAKKGNLIHESIDEEVIHRMKTVTVNKIKTVGEIFNDTFFVFRNNLKSSLVLAAILSAVVVTTFGIVTNGAFQEIFVEMFEFELNPISIFWCWMPYYDHLDFDRYMFMFPLTFLGTSLLLLFGYSHFQKIVFQEKFKPTFLDLINALSIALAAVVLFLTNSIISFFLGIVWWPFCMFWFAESTDQKKLFLITFFSSFGKMLRSFGTFFGSFWATHAVQWITMLLLNGTLIFIFGLLLTGTNSNFLIVIFQFIQMNIPRNVSFAAEVPYIIYTFLLFFVLATVAFLSVYTGIFTYYSSKEINEASNLNEEIKKIGTKKRPYGLEKE